MLLRFRMLHDVVQSDLVGLATNVSGNSTTVTTYRYRCRSASTVMMPSTIKRTTKCLFCGSSSRLFYVCIGTENIDGDGSCCDSPHQLGESNRVVRIYVLYLQYITARPPYTTKVLYCTVRSTNYNRVSGSKNLVRIFRRSLLGPIVSGHTMGARYCATK